jgi:hypothetical protein
MNWIIMPHERAMMNAGLNVRLGPSNQDCYNRIVADGRRENIPLLPSSKSWCDVDTSPPIRPSYRKIEPDSFDMALSRKKESTVALELESYMLAQAPVFKTKTFTPMREPVYEPANISETILKYGSFKDPDPDPILDPYPPTLYVPRPEPIYSPDNFWKKHWKDVSGNTE